MDGDWKEVIYLSIYVQCLSYLILPYLNLILYIINIYIYMSYVYIYIYMYVMDKHGNIIKRAQSILTSK